MLLYLKIAGGLLLWSAFVVFMLSLFKINRPETEEE